MENNETTIKLPIKFILSIQGDWFRGTLEIENTDVSGMAFQFASMFENCNGCVTIISPAEYKGMVWNSDIKVFMTHDENIDFYKKYTEMVKPYYNRNKVYVDNETFTDIFDGI